MPYPTPRPVTQDDRDEILALHAQGLSRNEIRRRTGRASATVSKVVADAGLTFARGEQVAAATAARKADLEALRVEEAYHCLIDAARLREQMYEPTVVYAFGGRDNVYSCEPVAEPPPSDKRSLASAAGMLYDRSMRLCPPDTGNGAEQARSMVGQLMAGLAEVYREQQTGDGAGDAP